MQHRRKKKPYVVAVLALALAGGLTFLIMKPVPAPQSAIVKPLETAKFIKPSL